MKVDYPGLVKEKLPSGNIRLRVRVEGKPNKRIVLCVGMDHPDFSEYYHAARRGIKLEAEATPEERAIRGSFGWLVAKHITHLEKKVKAEQYNPITLKKTKQLLMPLSERYFDYVPIIPTKILIKLRDEKLETPAAADDMIEKLRVLYDWAIDMGLVDYNPAKAIKNIYVSKGGAVPWTLEDLNKFKEHHGKGTTPHLCLTILLFTACRVSDLTILGRPYEKTIDGVKVLAWQPLKKSANFTQIPMLKPLLEATRRPKVQGATYLINQRGKPYSVGSIGAMFRRWFNEAGLKNRSAHGVRKAVGGLLVEFGCTEYQVMAIHGHTESRTSQVYTKGADRLKLAQEAVKMMEQIKW